MRSMFRSAAVVLACLCMSGRYSQAYQHCCNATVHAPDSALLTCKVISLQKVVITLNINELQGLDKIHRRIIRNISNRPCSDENLLTAFFVRYQKKIPPINKYPYIFRYEYEVNPGYSNHGKGDLIFTDGKNNFCIVEIKFLTEKSGRNYCVKRTQKRKKVRWQERYYKSCFQKKNPTDKVESCHLTNDLFKHKLELGRLFQKFKEEKEAIWRKKKT